LVTITADARRRIRELIHQAKMSASRLEEKAGIGKGVLLRIVRGLRKTASRETLAKVARALGVRIDALLGAGPAAGPRAPAKVSVRKDVARRATTEAAAPLSLSSNAPLVRAVGALEREVERTEEAARALVERVAGTLRVRVSGAPKTVSDRISRATDRLAQIRAALAQVGVAL
jgi:transcriptional regulator with XRE-family HTH domain